MNTGPVSLRAYARLIRTNRNFRLLWLAQIVSELGDWLYAVAIYSLILEVTGSASAVAGAFVLQVLPQFFVAPAAGVLNDRASRRKVLMAADWVRAAVTFAMLFAQTLQILPLLYALLFLETVCWAFFEPGRNAIIPNITRGKEELLVANALSSTTWSVNLAIGAAVGGLLAAALGRNAVFVIDSATFIVSGLLIRAMRFEEVHLAGVGKLRKRDLIDFSPIAEGVRYVLRDARLVATMLVKGGIGVMAANWVILPVFGERIFPIRVSGLDPAAAGMLGMSLLMGSRGVGALIGPLAASVWSGSSELRFRIGIAFAFAIGALGYFSLGYAPGLWFACLCVAVAHCGGSIGWVFSTTLLQLYSEDRFRGRVFSAELACNVVVMAVVTAGAGALVDAGTTVYQVAKLIGLLVLVPGIAWVAAQRLWSRRAMPHGD
jgi:MFS family permease